MNPALRKGPLFYKKHLPFSTFFNKKHPPSFHFLPTGLYYLALEMASPLNQHCANCIGTLSFPVLRNGLVTERRTGVPVRLM